MRIIVEHKSQQITDDITILILFQTAIDLLHLYYVRLSIQRSRYDDHEKTSN